MNFIGMNYVVSIGDYDGPSRFPIDKTNPPEGYLNEKPMGPKEFEQWRAERIIEDEWLPASRRLEHRRTGLVQEVGEAALPR